MHARTHTHAHKRPQVEQLRLQAAQDEGEQRRARRAVEELRQAVAYLCHVLLPAAGDASWMAQQQEPDALARLHAVAGPRAQRSR